MRRSLHRCSLTRTALISLVIFYLSTQILISSIHTAYLFHTESCALPVSSRAEENFTIYADYPGCTQSIISKNTFVPIFILTRDRVTSLKNTLDTYHGTLSSPYEIIILDHNSTYGPMIKHLHQLERQGVVVHRLQQRRWKDALDESSNIIRDYLYSHNEVEFYAFTDPDISFVRTRGDILLFLAGMLLSCPFKVIGPHLQISDLPHHYETKTKFERRGALQSPLQAESKFWEVVPNMATWKGVGYHFAELPIDTTFAMRRRETRMGRLQSPSARTHAPYSAVHTDWYSNSSSVSEEKAWYLKNLDKPSVNHW